MTSNVAAFSLDNIVSSAEFAVWSIFPAEAARKGRNFRQPARPDGQPGCSRLMSFVYCIQKALLFLSLPGDDMGN